MSDMVYMSGTAADFHNQIAGALTSKNGHARIIGRAMADGWPTAMQNWVNAEAARKTDPVELLHAIADLQIQTFASLAAYVLRPEGHGLAVKLYKQVSEDVMLKHMQRCAEEICEERRP